MFLKLLCASLISIVLTQPYEGGSFVGEKSANKDLLEYPVILKTTTTNGGHQTTNAEVIGNSGNESPVEFVSQNTENLPAIITTTSRAQVQKPGGLRGLFQIFGNAIHEVVNENAERFNSEVDAILEVGQSILHAGHNIVDAKKNAIASIPRGWHKVFVALEKH